MSEQFFALLTGASVLFWMVVFVCSKEVPSRKYVAVQISVGLFTLSVIALLLKDIPLADGTRAPDFVIFRSHIFCVIASFLVAGALLHTRIFNEIWTFKTLALLTLSLGIACRAFLFDDILLSGTLLATLLLLFSQAPLIAGRVADREELTAGLFFFLLIVAGFGMSSGFFESGGGSLKVLETSASETQGDPKAQLGWLFGFATSLLVLVIPFFGIFQSGVHRAQSWSIHNWLVGLLVLSGASACLGWIDTADRHWNGLAHFSKVLCLSVSVLLSSLGMIQGFLSKRVSAVLQAWTMPPLFAGFVAYALGTPEGEVLSVLSFALWAVGLVAVGGALNLLGIRTDDGLGDLSRRLLDADRFSRGLFLFSLALLSPLGSLVFMKAVTLTLNGDLKWTHTIFGGTNVWVFPFLFLLLITGMVAAFVTPLMRVYPISTTRSNSSTSSRPLAWDQVKVAILLVPVIVVGIYSTHLYKYMAKILEP